MNFYSDEQKMHYYPSMGADCCDSHQLKMAFLTPTSVVRQ
jgi:hypothetical protein